MPPVQESLLCRLISSWMIIEVTTVPLFHVHIPATTDTWSVISSGGPHTVFTPDLPGEYSYIVHDVLENHSHFGQRILNSPELAFFICTSDDDKHKALYVAASTPSRTPLPSDTVFAYPQTYGELPLSDASKTSRAPPLRVVV
jgi:hypothetical protein